MQDKMKFRYNWCITLFFTLSELAVCYLARAQTSALKAPDISPLSFSGYIEVYYGQDVNKPAAHTRPGFIYSHNKTGEFAVNLAYLKASYQRQNVRANISLAAGSYMNANYAAEQGVLKNVYEADAGVKISKRRDLWIDAGILPSHIGFESAVEKDCWTLTRSLLAENSPYFETGARLSYSSRNKRWYVAALVLNGWQRIEMPEGNNIPSFGHQITFKPSDKLTLNSSSFVGNDKADSVGQWRLFHDFYMQYQLSGVFGFIAGFDIAAEQKAKGSSSYNLWYSPVLIGRFTLSDRSALALRGEYYQDKNGVLISENTREGFRTFGYSINYDLSVTDHVIWRLEARNLSGRGRIFQTNGQPRKDDLFFTTSLAVSF